MSFFGVEITLVGGLFIAGLILGIFSFVTMRMAEKSGIRTYMMKPIILVGFILVISWASLLISSFTPVAVPLSIHFGLKTLALVVIIYGVFGYYRMLGRNT